jgi:anti-sigma B factor antagonist
MPDPHGRIIDAGLLTIDVIASDGTCVVQLKGELDRSSAPKLEKELSDLLGSDLKTLTVDLARLAFIDSAGLRCLLSATELAATDGNSLQFVAPSGQAEKILELTGLRQELPFTD